jgi:diguanylate cyclase (GGDEF)-like protein
LVRGADSIAAMALETIPDGARLAALEDLGILDTEPEEAFDRFTRLAADLLHAPVSLVSLVDRDRQFFKSQAGLPAPWSEARQTPLSHSLCQYAVAAKRPLVISDARKDPRYADNLAVRDLSVVAYAGIPLVLDDGQAVGAFCAIDTSPRNWTEDELRILDDLAGAVIALLELRRTLAQQSLHDRLTGLPNRTLTVAYAEQLASALEDGELLAMAVGVDGLGAINSAYGNQHGDRVLTLLSRRIARQLEAEDVLGRLEGDIFTILRPRVSSQLEALELSRRIRESVSSEPITVRGEQLRVSVTVGLATAGPGSSGSVAIVRAREAMRLAKQRPDRVLVAEETRTDLSTNRMRVIGALRGATSRNEISVVFQPIVELSSGRTCGYEALARWTHPALGTVSPSEFIPLAEMTGEIVMIREHVLRTACAQLAAWRASSGEDLNITVNLSPVQLAVPNIAEVIRDILVENGLRGSALALEITEGVFMAPGAIEHRNLDLIRALGVQIALDDFGTGYSALSYLKRFPVDVIKADRSFLDGLGADRRDLAVMRAILAIGAGMDIQVVAEGVETHRQRELLRLSGCPYAQGYLFSQPLPAEEINVGHRPLRTHDADAVARPDLHTTA